MWIASALEYMSAMIDCAWVSGWSEFTPLVQSSSVQDGSFWHIHILHNCDIYSHLWFIWNQSEIFSLQNFAPFWKKYALKITRLLVHACIFLRKFVSSHQAIVRLFQRLCMSIKFFEPPDHSHTVHFTNTLSYIGLSWMKMLLYIYEKQKRKREREK